MTDEHVALAVLAAELGTTADELAAELGQEDVFRDAAGFRCCAVSKASEVIETRERRQKEAAERRERRAAEAKARAAELRQAGIERGRAYREAAARGEFRVRKMKVTATTEVQGLDALPSATGAMLAGAPVEYEGGVSTPRPSAIDWLTGQGEGGGTIGPVRRPKRKGG